MSQSLLVFSIFDKKANDYGVPFFQLSAGVAKRTLCDLVSDPRSFLAAHPEDYDLYCLGSYDSASGLIQSRTPEFIAGAAEYSPRVTAQGVQGGTLPPPCPSATDQDCSVCSDESTVTLPAPDINTAFNAQGDSVRIAGKE